MGGSLIRRIGPVEGPMEGPVEGPMEGPMEGPVEGRYAKRPFIEPCEAPCEKHLRYNPNLSQKPPSGFLRFFKIQITHRNVSHFTEGFGVFLSI